MKARSRVFLLMLLLIVVLWPDRKLTAKSYDIPPVCVAFNLAKAVFIGRVVNASQKREYVYHDKTNEPSVSCSLELVFEVIESFPGTAGRLMTVWDNGGQTCKRVDYTPGEVYLVYAYGGEDGKLWAGARTRSLKQDSISASDDQWIQEYRRKSQIENDEELEILRSVSRKTLSGARIYGGVGSSRIIPGKNVNDREDSFAGVTIKIEGERLSLEVKTDGYGNFDVQGLEPGIYKVTAVLPEGYVPVRSMRRWGDDHSKSWDKELLLRDCGCVKLIFELDPSAKVDGRVLDAEGKPLAGVEVSLISEKWREEAEIKDGDIQSFQTLYGKTGVDGKYKIEKVAPGRYLLGVNVIRPIPQSPYPRIFYPDVYDFKQAEVITVEPGKIAGPFDLNLTRRLEMRAIQGIVLWPDGAPAIGAKVELRHPGDWLVKRRYEVTTDEQGRFTIKGLKDYEYEIIGCWHEDQRAPNRTVGAPFGWRSATSEKERLTIIDDVKGLKILLSLQRQ